MKSDDVIGRTKLSAIVKGDDTFEAGIPESFSIFVGNAQYGPQCRTQVAGR